MLGAELRNLKRKIRSVHDILTHTVHLVPEHESITAASLRTEVLQGDGLFGLLYAYDGIALFFEGRDSLYGVVEVLPREAVFRPEGGFMDLGRRRAGTNPAQYDTVRLERVAAAECAADIVRTAYIVKNHHHAGRRECPVFFRSYAAKFDILEFPV